jgi:hypothetical protein
MGLVDYSDSDASDIEETPALKPVTNTSKPAFQKVVDRSNPGKIRVSLPQAALKDDISGDEPSTKRAKTGGGGFSGFNSLLPAPQRTGLVTNATLGGSNAAKKGGLRAGVSLKTGSTPGFSRETESETGYSADIEIGENDGMSGNSGTGLSLPLPKISSNGDQKPAEEVKLVGKPLMFRPLSVTRKPAKKKKQVPTASKLSTPAPTPSSNSQSKEEKSLQRAKVSLFSMSVEPVSSPMPTSTGEYRPIIYKPSNQQDEEVESPPSLTDPSNEDYTPKSTHIGPPPAVPTPPVSQSLGDIASDLNLSAAARRQLFGRQKGSRDGAAPSATKIINFNTDKEYQHNEELRAAGEQAVHNPVRAIAPGKHNLKQLVNAAQSQKDALEESFAKGKSNRAEASSRYGW